jgi:hypothetical protein
MDGVEADGEAECVGYVERPAAVVSASPNHAHLPRAEKAQPADITAGQSAGPSRGHDPCQKTSIGLPRVTAQASGMRIT